MKNLKIKTINPKEDELYEDFEKRVNRFLIGKYIQSVQYVFTEESGGFFIIVYGTN